MLPQIEALYGSIPASAGEPPALVRRRMLSKVYPRECGGTPAWLWVEKVVPGLSPRVRGNPLGKTGFKYPQRSIPASAGEPSSKYRTKGANKVYPRECGGTQYHSTMNRGVTGLSPRVRGNHDQYVALAKTGGSIPASAGEPPQMALEGSPSWVYPRECGGTVFISGTAVTFRGLSPRVRGNLCPGQDNERCWRSIPASAGEPVFVSTRRARVSVYPRECGGTPKIAIQCRSAGGLSPRVRGNRLGGLWI